ncbi:MAG: helix-turn-helix domain-containing protein [Pseudooceanicola sp.]
MSISNKTQASTDKPRLQPIGSLVRRGAWRLSLPHARTEDVFVWTTRGQGTLKLLGRRRGMGVHNALFVPAGFVFAMDIGGMAQAQAMTLPAGSIRRFPREPVLLRVRDVQMQGAVGSILDALQREQSHDDDFTEETLRAYATLLAIWFRRTRGQILPDPAEPTAAERLAAAFMGLVELHFRSGRPMADYAEMLDVTPTHLSRVCRHTAGQTAAEILNGRVLHAARIALADTSAPIGQIASDLGFSSPAYFTRFMQHRTRQTPSALRRAG